MAVTERKKSGGGPAKSKKLKKGPHLPNMLKKEIESLNPKNSEEEENQEEDILDLYEYEEQIPDEESGKNRRYDHVDNFEYQLPKDFQDEDVASDDDEEEEEGGSHNDDADDDEKHSRVLHHITGLPADAFNGKMKRNNVIVSEAYPESEYNPSRDVLDGDSHITLDTLLNSIQGKPGVSKIRKDLQRMDRKSISIQPPLPIVQQQKIDRKATYLHSKKKLTEYEPLVKKNREAPTMYFDENTDVGYSTIGAIASDFKQRTELEKQVHSLVNINGISDAHRLDGERLLERNNVSVEDVKARLDHIAKNKALLFHHEARLKRNKKIKSKIFRRLLKKDKLKAGYNEIEMTPEAAKELAEKQEFKRAEERLTLKHKNTSKWAKRIKKRGFDIQDDGTRAAISEQLQQHALLTQKRNSMHDSDDDDSSDDSMDDNDDDEDISGDDDNNAKKLKLLEKGKKKILELIDEVDEAPKTGLNALPFMVRGQKKKRAAVDEEARLALKEFDSAKRKLEGDHDSKDDIVSVGGRKVFNAQKKKVQKSNKIMADRDNYFDNTDSENENDADTIEDVKTNYTQKDVSIDPNILRDESEVVHDSLFKSFDDISKNSGPKIEYDVSLFSTNSKKKKRNVEDYNHVKSEKKAKINKSQVPELVLEKVTDILEDGDDDIDTDNETRMVDGFITSGTDYELPSQEDLIKRAFAGDDVEEDFVITKQEILNEENPEPEKPVLLPGWGQWTHIQKKRGLPSWMLAEHERAKKKRDEDLKKRPDANLKHVIISEKVDKKAEKLQTKVLPYPYKDKEHFDWTNRMPLGPEFNPATTIMELNRPEVVKKAGVSIKPIKLKRKNK